MVNQRNLLDKREQMHASLVLLQTLVSINP